MTQLKLLKNTGLSTTVSQCVLLTFSPTPLSLFLIPTQIHEQSLLRKPVLLSITGDVSLMDWGGGNTVPIPSKEHSE